MKKIFSLLSIMSIASTILSSVTFADNPVVQTVYTADPAPLVHDGTVYLYTGHDLDVATTSYKMVDWKCYSSTDMVNWTDRGSVLDVTAFKWANQTQDANAAQVIYRNGKFYYYVAVSSTISGKGGIAIGVAVSDSPTGPFKDAIGGPLVTNDMTTYASHSWDDLDPTVFIDDEGQAYLYWGNNALYYARLNEDMISLKGSISAVPLTTEAFGPDYEEAPWIYKRNGLYYLAYASGFPESIRYSTSTSPTGPWTYRGVVMPQQGSSSTNHPGIIDFKGDSYFFYHKVGLLGGGSYKRSVSIEKFAYNADGTIPSFNMTSEGVASSANNLNPYTRNEAETIAWESGITTEPSSQGGMNVSSIDNGDYIKVEAVDFGATGAGTYAASVASGSGGGTIELHLDAADGPLIGTLPISNTGGDNVWKTKATSVSGATGVHDLFMVFRGTSTGNLFKVDYWQFGQKTAVHDLVAINASIDKQKIDIVSGTNKASIKVTAIYTDGTSVVVTSQAAANPVQSGILSVSNGVVTGVGYGSTSIDVSYGGKTDTLNMLVKDLKNEQTVKTITVDNASVALESGKTATFKVTAEYYDGHTEDVTTTATYSNPSPAIADVAGGTITAKASGTTNVAVSFKGVLGEAATAQITVSVNTPTIVAIVAETAAENTANAYVNGTISGHTWSLVDGQSTKAMFFGPNNGFTASAADAASLAVNSRLGYKINFSTAGTYNVWILVKTLGYDSDSVHVGLDNQYKFTTNGIEGVSGGQYKWANISGSSGGMFGGATLNVTAGVHELNFWGREDGLAIDRIYLTTSNATTDPVWPQPLVPTAALSADSSVKAGSSFTVGVSLNNVTQSVYAHDITLSYDSNVFDYVSAAGATGNIQIVTEDKSTAGKVRLITANTAGGITGTSTPVLNLTFKVKAGVQNTSGTVAATQAKLGVAPEGTVIQAVLGSKSISVGNIEVVVDKTALTAAITSAQSLYDAALVGTAAGQYPQAAKDAFGVALNAAKAVKDNQSATQSQVDSSVTALGNSVDTFKTAVMKSADLNKDGSINVGDLAMVAYNYGKNSTGTDWATAKIADMNNDNKIDINDLAFVASKIQ